MGKIKVLSELVANKIAAGEVVERPASVAKELIENSLDAGAGNISVAVRQGGKGLIRVKDDGHGMDREDASACLQRHATSKLSDAEEIERIATLGFRGEAIPSIASVSRLSLITRQKGDDTATVIKISGGVVESVSECVSGPGTVVEVSDLFFNTPARRKFLKSDAAEYNALAEIFNTLSLSCKEVHFALSRNGVETADYPSCGDLLQRIQQLYSSEFAEKLYPIAVEKPDFKLTGYIGTPDNTRVNRTGQKFFINNRPVHSISLSIALSRAYEEFLQQKRFPVAIFFLEIDRSYVDVNIHPTKREVKIQNERFFQDIIIKATRKQLREKGFFSENTARPDTAFVSEKHYYTGESSRVSFRRLKEASAGWESGKQGSWSPEEKASGKSLSSDHAPQYFQDTIDKPELDKNPFGAVRVLGQALGTYIIAESGESFAVFDQHAAHERILYEEILQSLDKNQTLSQKIIFPITLDLNIQEAPLMEQYIKDFQKIGFGINPLGGGTFSIDAVPAFMSDAAAENTIKDTLHELMEKPTAGSFESRRHELAAILACKTYSVKAGRMLDTQEMEHLILKLGTKDNPHICPHGRPTFFLLTKDELEKRFKRK